MHGFGSLKDLDSLIKIVSEPTEKPLVESTYTKTEQNKLDNLYIPMLENDEFVPVKKDEKKVEEVKKAVGAAGNTEEDKEEEPILGGMGMGGLGGGIKKEMSRMEAFNDDEATDEDPMKTEKERTQATASEKVKSFFNDIFDNNFGKAKNKDYDLDNTKIKNYSSTTPIKKIPKGW